MVSGRSDGSPSAGDDTPTIAVFAAAAVAGIAGCFALRAVLRSGASTMYMAPGLLSLALLVWLLTQAEVALS